jgi:hypothetical protein
MYHYPELVKEASSGLSNSGLVSTPPQKRKKKKRFYVKIPNLMRLLSVPLFGSNPLFDVFIATSLVSKINEY